jgi:S1-C subfamily serine protease
MTTNYPYPAPQGEPYGDPQYYGYSPEYGYYPVSMPPTQPPNRHKKRRRILGAGVAALAAAGLVAGIVVSESGSSTLAGSGSSALQLPTTPGSNGSGSSGGGNVLPGGSGGSGGLGGGSSLPGGGSILPGGSTGNGSGTSENVQVATDSQKTGIVTVVSVLQYQNAESAGTGMILTSNGEVLTNNHVVDGATSITVTVASTGVSYRANVVGTDPTDDVAVLQLQNASGLKTANVGDSSDVSVGDKVVGVGNAGGTGTLQASAGSVTALNQSITATDESGQDGEKLTGLIEVNADIISGDSGGPLYDSSGDIVGMDTAASANQTAQTTAYAIPIDSAVKIASEIETGVETTTIHIGLPAFLGVGIAEGGTQGATVTTLLDGGPAASAGVTEGSVITRVGGTKVTSADSLKTALQGYAPGKTATITWTDVSGASHTKTVTLGTGPAD